MRILVSLTYHSLQMLGKSETGIFLISEFLVKSLINKNCHNSRPKNHINMKLGPVTQLDKGNTTTSRKFDDDIASAIMTPP